MHRLNKLLPAILFFAFVLFFPAEMRADPLVISGGSVSIFGAVNSRNAWRGLTYDFSGQGISLRGGVGDGNSVRAPQTSCASGPCAPGTIVSPSSSFGSEGLGSASINGTNYQAWLFEGDTRMTFTAGSVLFPGDTNNASTVTLSTGFTMTGTLVIHDLNASGFPVVFTSPIIGQGIAFMTFQLTGQGPAFGYYLSGVRYEFAETPEPATLILLGTGLAGAAAYKRRRKRGEAQ